MGQCCGQQSKFSAFRKGDMKTPLLNEVSTQLPSEARVVVVRLSSLKDIPVGNNLTGLTDSFVEMKLAPTNPIVGEQKQLSSIKAQSLSPKWEPPERFQFIVPSMDTMRIVLSVFQYNRPNPQKSAALGDAVVKLKDLQSMQVLNANDITSGSGSISGEFRKYKLRSPTDGSQCGELELQIAVMTPQAAACIEEHTVYEFQRWQLVVEWGYTRPGHFLPTDPGRWCKENGSEFSDSFEKTVPALPLNTEADALENLSWVVTKPWYTVGSSYDPEGWQYGIDFNTPFWFPQGYNSANVVRRRTWQREVRKVKTSFDSAAPGRASAAPAAGV